MFSALFGFFGTVIKWTVIGVGGSFVLVGTFTYRTKPDDQSFDKFFKDYVKANVKDGSSGRPPKTFLESIAVFGVTKFVESTYDVTFRDYSFWKVSTVTFPGSNSSAKFIGAGGTWWPASS